MKIHNYLPLLVLVILSACSKKKDVNIQNVWSAQPVMTDISKDMAANPINADSITISNTADGNLISDGISLYTPPNAFTKADGTAVSGNILVKLQTISNVKDMVLSGITTSSNKGLLESGGMIRISAYDTNHNPLKLNTGISLVANFPVTGFTFGFPSAFKGTATTNDANKISWAQWGTLGPDGTTIGPAVVAQPNNPNNPNGAVGFRIINIDEISTWTNLDTYITSTSVLTDISITLPDGFSNLNTQCCFNYAGINSCAYLYANAGLKAFTTINSGFKVIKGKKANVIVLAKKSGTYYMQVIAVSSIGDNQTINANNLKETTLNAIKLVLAKL